MMGASGVLPFQRVASQIKSKALDRYLVFGNLNLRATKHEFDSSSDSGDVWEFEAPCRVNTTIRPGTKFTMVDGANNILGYFSLANGLYAVCGDTIRIRVEQKSIQPYKTDVFSNISEFMKGIKNI